MINGAHSGLAVVGLLVVLALRFVAAQRRRTPGRPGNPRGARGFAPASGRPDRPDTEADRRPSAGAAGTSGAGPGGTSPGWFRDPFVRHEQRYWSGSAWTEHVQDHGVPDVDPPPTPRAP